MWQDYDCFYAQVIESQKPALKSLPLGIKQKSILATCNYEARRRGVKKLMLIADAKKICPDLVLADGEDLTAFRDISKRLYSLLRSFSWNNKVERLGLDEVFMDVTDVVAYNAYLINRNSLSSSFFQLSRHDPLKGFSFDASRVAGCVVGPHEEVEGQEDELSFRMLIASHLARYLRLQIEEQGYTSACGIATNKVLAKLVGNQNKPRNQTVMLRLQESGIGDFMDSHVLRKIPGIGSRMAHVVENHISSGELKYEEHTQPSADSATVGQVRKFPSMSPHLLEKLFAGRGFERGVGDKVWHLLHGIDRSEVKIASDIPTQISIEDTYKGLDTTSEVSSELEKLLASLLRRMHVDLVREDADSAEPGAQKWVAHPRTIRLTTRPKTSAADGKPYNFQRASKSHPLPGYVFSFTMPRKDIIAGLLHDHVLPLFRSLNPGDGGWNIGLLNVCVTGMVLSGNSDPTSNGRDIGAMFRRQEDVLRDFTVYDTSPPQDGRPAPEDGGAACASDSDGWTAEGWEEEEADEQDFVPCSSCGYRLPTFAVTAHQRYHLLGD